MPPMRQAIVTKYLGPTTHRGARIKATALAGSVTVALDYALSAAQNHAAAAAVLANKYEWLEPGVLELRGGALPDGYCWVIVEGCHAA